MASDWSASLKEINGVNLANYFPQQRSYNSVVFVHKKYLERKLKKEKVKPKKDKQIKQDKSQQFNYDLNTEVSKDKTYRVDYHDNSVLEQTIRFAKNIVPMVIPPSEDKSNIYYTIKTAKRHKKKEKRHSEPSYEHHESTHEREEPKKTVETFRKVRKESISVKESVSHSSNNTFDDLNINQSLCCTFSEVSDKKCHKKDKGHHKKLNHGQKFAISESFEAVATENTAGDGKIKIHLMNEKDKHFLSDSIKEPVLNAIRDCILELNNNQNTEITTVQRFVKCNTQKLDTIIEKLTCIEKKLDTHEMKLDIHEKKIGAHERQLVTHKKMLDTYDKKSDVDLKDVRIPLPKVQECKSKAKASTLEELGEDLIEIKEEYSSEEELHHETLDRRSSTVVLEFVQEDQKKMEASGGGEVPRSVKGWSTIGASKLERPNRLPARFCWTDSKKN
ncbi:uncharacterized protein LOC142979773 [Anticarsia gemmatalis]|uniref:uncharacterized protein LOC142979773 n=1 Tax=Anticarsia gemmatalis TaxID=129554 RepID=UPI003F76AD84